jgi:hypothetical protein
MQWFCCLPRSQQQQGLRVEASIVAEASLELADSAACPEAFGRWDPVAIVPVCPGPPAVPVVLGLVAASGEPPSSAVGSSGR